MTSGYDSLIIGAGHNGLTTAAYLAAAGQRVLVLERRPVVGGACVTEELAPGYRASTCSYLVSLLADEVVRDLELHRHGYQTLPREPASCTLLADGRALMMGADTAFNQAQIAQFSTRDAERFPQYMAFLERVAAALEPVINAPPPGLLPLPASWRQRSLGRLLGDLAGSWRMRRALASLGEEQAAAMRLLLDSARQVLDRWFESDALKSTLASDGVIGAFLPPSAPGTGYVLLHHVMGTAGGARGVWAYARGGMGAITQAMAACCVERGVVIRCDAAAAEILLEQGRACGVRLTTGEVIHARRVISNATPAVTFEKLLPAGATAPAFGAAVRQIDYASGSAKINLAVAALPGFRAFGGATTPGPQHRGTIHIGAGLERLERAYDDAKYGRPSTEPFIEMTIPSVHDDSLAPPGHHIVQLFVQYAPYELRDGDWESERAAFADRCLALIDTYAPGFAAQVLHRQVLTPPDLEREFGLTGGNIFHGAMSPSQLFSLRPVPGWADHRTPVAGLYLCGSGCHPGGGVTGLPGRNAARAVLADRR